MKRKASPERRKKDAARITQQLTAEEKKVYRERHALSQQHFVANLTQDEKEDLRSIDLRRHQEIRQQLDEIPLSNFAANCCWLQL